MEWKNFREDSAECTRKQIHLQNQTNGTCSIDWREGTGGTYFLEIAPLFLQSSSRCLVPSLNHFPFRETHRDFAEWKTVQRTIHGSKRTTGGRGDQIIYAVSGASFLDCGNIFRVVYDQSTTNQRKDLYESLLGSDEGRCQ